MGEGSVPGKPGHRAQQVRAARDSGHPHARGHARQVAGVRRLLAVVDERNQVDFVPGGGQFAQLVIRADAIPAVRRVRESLREEGDSHRAPPAFACRHLIPCRTSGYIAISSS